MSVVLFSIQVVLAFKGYLRLIDTYLFFLIGLATISVDIDIIALTKLTADIWEHCGVTKKRFDRARNTSCQIGMLDQLPD